MKFGNVEMWKSGNLFPNHISKFPNLQISKY